MEIRDLLKQNIQLALKDLGVDLDLNEIVVENSKDPTHGDYATNVAMKMARAFSKSPRDVAALIVDRINKDHIDHIEIAGPGFINFYMKNDSITGIVNRIIKENDNYGRSQKKNLKVNVEFVSANPTGDLHVGHARGAAIGDAISRILDFDGYDVTREYYINDAGNYHSNYQKMDTMVKTLKSSLKRSVKSMVINYSKKTIRLSSLSLLDKN